MNIDNGTFRSFHDNHLLSDLVTCYFQCCNQESSVRSCGNQIARDFQIFARATHFPKILA